MPPKKPWYAPLIETWSNKIMHFFTLACVAWLGLSGEEEPEEKGGNLQGYVNAHIVADDGFKTWVSREFEKRDVVMNKNTERRLREEGAELERERYMVDIEETEIEIVNGIPYIRNRVTNKLFWVEPSTGAKHEVSYVSGKGYCYKLHGNYVPTSSQ